MKKNSLPPLRRFINLLEVDKQEILSVYVYALFSGIIALSLPLGIQAIINLIRGAQVSTSWIIMVSIVIAGVALNGVIQIMQVTITENIQQKIFTRSAFEFAYRIPRLNLSFVGNRYLPEIVNRFFDTLTVQKGLSKILLDFSGAILQSFFGLVLLSLYHPFFILFSFILLILGYLLFKYTIPRGLRTSLKESKEKYEVAHWLEEIGRAMITFKLAGNTKLPLQKTDDLVGNYLKARQTHFRSLRRQFINLVAFKVIIATGLLLMGGLLVLNQQMNIGQFVASEIIIILILNSVEKLIMSMETIYDVVTAVEKIGQVTDLPLQTDSGKSVDAGNNGLAISFRDISFPHSYRDKDVFKEFNLEIKPGEKVCIGGPGGSGKSTLLQLAASVYEVNGGCIYYDDIPKEKWNAEILLSQVGDSLAREDIFKATLAENITLGKPGINLEQLEGITNLLGLDEFISELPDGLDTMMTPEGFNLPRSIRTRIMLARCITGESRLILLEDNFNGLKPADKTRYLDFVLSRDWTVVAVSNDAEIVSQFQRYVVLKDGEVFADGKPQELLNRPEIQTLMEA